MSAMNDKKKKGNENLLYRKKVWRLLYTLRKKRSGYILFVLVSRFADNPGEEYSDA